MSRLRAAFLFGETTGMNMELVAQILAVVLAAFFASAGAVLCWIVNRIARLERDLAAYKLHAEGHFVTEADLTRSVNQLEVAMERLIQTINALSSDMRTGFSGLQTQVNGKADKA